MLNLSKKTLKRYFCLRFLKHSIFVFCQKKDGFFWKRALTCIKIAHCDNVFQKVYRMVLLLRNSRNVQRLRFFWRKMRYSNKGPWNVSRSLTVTIFSSKCLKRYYCLRIIKNFKFWLLFWKKLGFFDIESWNVSRLLTVTNVSRMRIKRYYWSWFFKTFKIWVFLGKKWVIPKKGLERFQNRSRWQIFLESVSTGIVA